VPRGGRRLISLAGRLRRHAVAVAIVGSSVEVLFAAVFAFQSHRDILGLAGAEAAVVGLAVAVLAGPWPGVITTTAGATAFWLLVADLGETAPTSATIAAALLWGVSAFAAGAISDELRRQTAARRRADDERMRLHREMEKALLPTLPRLPDGYRTAMMYRPGEERLGLGGDFYDIQTLDSGGLALLIGDVSGHGPHSAALGASLRTAWRGLVQAGVDDLRLATALSRTAEGEKTGEDLFSTLWLGWLDPSGTRLRMGSFGHPPPLLLARAPRFLEAQPSPPLGTGVGSRIDWRPCEIDLPPSWTLLLYTDGLVEGRASVGASERFGYERLLQWFATRDTPVVDGDCLGALLSTVEEAHGGTLPDDVAVLAVTHAPATAARDGAVRPRPAYADTGAR
jgi:serine phosphatase RsbU (regulator of sigma subunit)